MDKQEQARAEHKGGRHGGREPLRCGLVGCGRVALKHLKAIRAFPKELVLCGVVDPRPEAAIELFRAAGIRQNPLESNLYYRSLEDLLSQNRPDLTAITTPSGTHGILAQKALDASCHVLVEKPLTLSLKDADQLIEKAKSSGKVLAVGHIYRYFPLVRSIRKALLSGQFGTVQSGRVSVFWGHDQAYYDAASWRGTWQQDGGVLMNQCVHALDLMLYLMNSPITVVNSWIDQINHQMEAEDYGLVQMRFASGAYGMLEGSTATSPLRQEATFAIQCSAGSIQLGFCRGKPSVRIVDSKGKEWQRRFLAEFVRDTLREEGIRGLRQAMHPHTVLYRDVIEAIRTGRQPEADGKSGRQAVEAVLAAYASALKGGACALPIDNFALTDMAGFFNR